MITLYDILLATSHVYGIPINVLDSPKRTHAVSQARQVAYCAARNLTDKSFPQIGRVIGNRDHSTVVQGINAFNRRADPSEHDKLVEVERVAAELARIKTPVFQTTRRKPTFTTMRGAI